MVSQQVPDRVAEAGEMGQDFREGVEIAVDHIAEVEGEGEVFLGEIRCRCFQLRDRFPVMALTRRVGVGVLHIGDQAEGEQRFFGNHRGLGPRPDHRGGCGGEGEETAAVHGRCVSLDCRRGDVETPQFAVVCWPLGVLGRVLGTPKEIPETVWEPLSATAENLASWFTDACSVRKA